MPRSRYSGRTDAHRVAASERIDARPAGSCVPVRALRGRPAGASLSRVAGPSRESVTDRRRAERIQSHSSTGRHRPRARRRGIRHRRCRRTPLQLAVADVAELAEVLDVGALTAISDRLLSRRDPLATRADLERMHRRFLGGRGSRRRRLAVDFADDRAESPEGSELRVLLIQAGLPTPECTSRSSTVIDSSHASTCCTATRPHHRVRRRLSPRPTAMEPRPVPTRGAGVLGLPRDGGDGSRLRRPRGCC